MGSTTTITIEPLPDAEEDTQIGNSPFVYGYCGLEACYLRGMVRIEHKGRNPLPISSLTIEFKGETVLSFAKENGERMKVNKILVLVAEILLKDETLPPGAILSLPFQLALPEPSSRHAELVKQSVRLANILTPPSKFTGISTHGAPYDGATTYTLKAELKEQPAPSTSFFSSPIAPPPKSVTVAVFPFLIHDPRQLPLLIQPDGKRWRSAPGDSPVEYEIEITSTTLGPKDTFSFLYRLAVARDAAAKGVRVKKVVLALREHKTLGTTISHLVPPSYKCIRGSIEVKRWDFEEAGWNGRKSGTTRANGSDLLVESSEDDDGYQDFGFEIEGDGVASAAEDDDQCQNGNNDDDLEDDGTGTEDGSGAGSSTFSGSRELSPPPSASPLNKTHPQKIKVQSRQTRSSMQKLKPNTKFASRGRRQNRGFDAGIVEMSELRPRRKMVEGMSTYNPSHALSTNAQSYDHALRRRANTFADGWSGGPGGDGLYVENEAIITMPSLSAFVPDTFKTSDNNLMYPNPHNHMYSSVPYIEVKHTLQVRVELTGVEKAIVHECWVTIASVGKQECYSILDDRIELMPTMDYDKIFGTDTWVPAYVKIDPFLGDLGGNSSSSTVASNQAEDEDEFDAFFGPLKHLVKKPYPSPATNHQTSQSSSSNAIIPQFQFRSPEISSSSSAFTFPQRSITPSPNRIPPHSQYPQTGSSPSKDFSNNYFQKRPSISSILSFTAIKHKSPHSPSASEYNGSDFEESENEDQVLPTSSSSSKAVGRGGKRKMSIQTNMPNLEPPPLPSAHTLLSGDALVAMQSPTNQRLFQELVEDRSFAESVGMSGEGREQQTRSTAALHYPLACVDVSPSDGRGEEDASSVSGGEVEEQSVKHPLLREEEIEARRRKVLELKLERKSRSLATTSETGHQEYIYADRRKSTPPVLDGEAPPLYSP
ncbi:hypothetical protein BDR26DRAFT_403472 [Obelidium mucronatum]|nr:hypothetical protein BDR26DRAFT_403472 [Obelidium mucronatum]